MKLSIRLIIGAHKKTFTFATEKILVVVFSAAILILLMMDKVHAEAVVESSSTAALNASALENPDQALVSPGVTSPATINASISTNKPTLTDPKKISSGSQLANLVGGLILILGLIYGLSWFVKRFSQGGFMQNSTIKMLSAMPIGTRERIMLIDVGGKQILLGVTATSIHSLHVFDEPVINTTENVTATGSDFSQKLMTLLQKNTVVQKNTATTKNTMQQDLSNSTSANLKNTNE